MIERFLANNIIDMMEYSPAVAILGPRQVGKTTVSLDICNKRNAVYLDLEDNLDLEKIKDSAHYFDQHTDRLIVLDEIQNLPNLFNTLRVVIDKYRRTDKPNGRFLILGSASRDLLKQSNESLAGRIFYMELAGLNPLEIEEIEAPNEPHLQQLWVRGGFPLSYLAPNDRASMLWRQNFINTYLERDIPRLGYNIPTVTLRRFWTMLAHTQGELFNASKIAESLGVKSVTVSRYLDMMTDLMLIRRLEPWYGNLKKRLVKAPRVYIRDSGILHSLLRIPNYEDLLGHPVLGKSWEGFIIESIIVCLPPHVHTYFYRTAVGAEIDLVLEFAPDDYWAVEIKASRTPIVKKGFHIACDDLKVKRKIVVYPGKEEYSLGQNTMAIPPGQFLKELRELN